MTPGVWESAASRLMEASVDKMALPIDPEFFVAVQQRSSVRPDPWAELTQQHSIVVYKKTVKRIVVQLRKELKAEVARVECRLLRGVDLEEVLETEGYRISPLSRYILSSRAGRSDLSARHHAEALKQHHCCPLYRLAARSLIPVHAYPSNVAITDTSVTQPLSLFSRN